ncbi:ABC transporter substrate-binding protein [Hyella patelloides]|uniref:ABC transporter substrate-binding protein n=1 Tax=Hyella patelloides TaxID=1982969 RepID=UPI001FE9A9F5|nr:sugar ABC transporter substrate-binding protein [Hyella patelloides]
MKTKFSLVIFLGLFLSVLSGCGSSSNTNTQEVEFWTMQLQPQFTQYFSSLNSNFEQDRESTIRWVDIPWSAMESKILTAISANTAPDVVNLNPNFASQLATRNAWLDVDEVISPQQKDTYLPRIWQASSLEICQDDSCESTTFGIPWYLTTRVTIYNQQLLEQVGIVEPPQTYEKLAIAAKQIKAKTGKYAFFVTFVPGDSGEVLESLVQMEVTLLDEEGKAAFNTPEGIAAFRYWVDLYQQKLLPPEVLTQGHRYGVELYQGGEIAFLSSGAEFLEAIATNAPTIAKVSATAPQITGQTGKKNVAVMNLAIPRNTDKPEEALNYALYVTNTENQLAFAKAANVLPSTKEAVEKYIQELSTQETITPVEEARKVSAMQLQDAEVLIPAMDNLQVLQKVIYENLQAAMLEEKTVEQAVKDAAAEWDASL